MRAKSDLEITPVMETDAGEYFRQVFAGYWRPEKPMRPSELMENKIILPSRVTPNEGPLSFDRQPFWREIADCLADPNLEDIVICAGSQLGKTTLCAAAVGYNLLTAGWPMLWVMPSGDMAKSFSLSRFQPIIEASPDLRVLKPSKRHRYKALEMAFANATLNLVGANSPANIASRPIGMLILDEVDKYPGSTSKEASAIALALERTKRYPMRKHLITSTPTRHDQTVWQFYLLGDQCQYHVPSPHKKGVFLPLPPLPKFDKIAGKTGKIDITASAKTARVECPETGREILDGDKYDLLQAGKWVPQNPHDGVAKRRSFQIPSSYSLDFTWRDIVEKYLTEKTMPSGTQNFWNGWGGLPYDESDDIELRVIPAGEYAKSHDWGERDLRAVVLAVDVQRDHFWQVARGLRQNGEMVLIEQGKLDAYEDIEELREKLKIEPDLVFLDCGYNKNEVLAQCAKYGWTAMNGLADRGFFWHQEPGRERVSRVWSPPETEPAYHAGGAMVPVIKWSSQAGQDLLEYCMKELRWSKAVDVSPEYDVHMRSHRKISKVKKGRTVYEWEQIGKTPDHMWDCETMAVVAFDALGLLPNAELTVEE